jgi:hypothetical protein
MQPLRGRDVGGDFFLQIFNPFGIGFDCNSVENEVMR